MKSCDTVRPFPARVPPLPGESLASLLRRTSQAMGYESMRQVATLLAVRGPLPPHLNQLTPGRAFDYLTILVRQPAETISSLTVHHWAPSVVLVPNTQPAGRVCDSKTVLRYFPSCWPVCPRCLTQDAVPYERLLWSFRPIPVCLEHGCVLVSRCPACTKQLRWDRQNVALCHCGQRLGDVQAVAVSSQGLLLAGRLDQLLSGNVSPLTAMSSAACFWWLERMTAAILQTPGYLADAAERLGLTPQAQAEAVACLTATEILSGWPQSFDLFLDAFQQIEKYTTTSTGVSRRFGLLLRRAAWLEDQGYAAPATALRQYLLEHYAGGHLSGKICLFRKSKDRAALRGRAWITQTSAGRLLRLSQPTITSLLEQGVLTGRLHRAGTRGRSVGLVLRQSVAALQQQLRAAVGTQAAGKRLGIDRHRVLELIHEGMLPRAVRTAKGWRIPLESVAAIESVCERMPEGRPESGRWLSLHLATRLFGPTGLTLALLLELIQTGKIAARMAEPQKRLGGIVVARADLVAQSPAIRDRRHQEHGYPVHHLRKHLFPDRPIKSSVVKKWISAKLLKACKRGRACVVTAEEVERFRSEYCLADEACRLLGIARSTLAHWEAEGRVRPVYGKRVTPDAGFSLYRRADLAHLSRRRKAAA